MWTSFHHRPEAQHPNSSAIHKLAGRLPHLSGAQRTSAHRQGQGRAIRQVCSLQPAALRVLANDTDKMVALLKGTTGRDAGLIATTQNVAA